MANGSISSVPVLDNHSNVVGNISQVDVKVSNLRVDNTLHTDLHTAPHHIYFITAPSIIMHALHLRHPIRAWNGRWEGFCTCILHHT